MPYAAPVEEGGTFFGLRAIPLRGVRGGPREDGVDFVYRGPTGRLFLAKRVGQSIALRFLLADKIRLPARRYLDAGLAAAEALLDQATDAAFLEVVDGK